MGWFGGGTCPLFMLLFWGLVILGLVVALVRWLAQSSSGKTRENSALDILADGTEVRAAGQGWPACGFKERYARGEIDRDEFVRTRTGLEK
jgi:uncharacterized membrane protein